MGPVLIIFSKGACGNLGIKEGQLFSLQNAPKGLFLCTKLGLLSLPGCLNGPKVTQYVLQLVYITPLDCLRVIFSFSVHHLGQLEVSPSGGLVFGKSVFVTLDA